MKVQGGEFSMSEIAEMYKEVKEINDHIKRVKEVYGKGKIESKKQLLKSYCSSKTKALPICK